MRNGAWEEGEIELGRKEKWSLGERKCHPLPIANTNACLQQTI